MNNVVKNIEISQHLNFGVGGKVSHFVTASNKEDILSAVAYAKKEKIPYLILGGGNNIVSCDKKIKCLVIKISSEPDSVGGEIKIKDNKIYTDAGILLSDLVSTTVKNGFVGLETLSGIPGTVGGSIYGNAGAYGHSISEFISSVTIFDGKKIIKTGNKDCHFGYRESVFKKKKWIIIGAEFKFKKGDAKELTKISEDIIETRWKKFGPKPKCPGSYFKNIIVKDISKKSLAFIDPSKIKDGKIPVGYLLEEVGAKGMREGGIYVSDFHGNIILNDGTGKYNDLTKLVKKLKSLVKKKFGIEIEEEVQYLHEKILNSR
ncbi:MAG: UDP-N-acetylenolpyruvoylglucosamine reductase [Parcubacteria group bacterium GW2011_GWF2_38_76]|nr:MAG: UDP-N-acetylenolpyruvoylglucosamine reductase [Parcubacteria group bacterium GW2011_GWF2_38_76]HBM45690.1 UDP-N-acetylenolpyruvoylglucosamine reductase [Patescibacteria group bacterium]